MESQSNDMTLEEMANEIRVVETERLRLRPLAFEDREHVWSAAHHPADITKGMIWDPPESLEKIDEWTKNTLEAWKRGDNLTWTIEDRQTHSFLGRITVRKHEDKNDSWYIGYWIHPDHHGNGYMPEAAKAVVDAAFQCIKMQKIISSHADWNDASGKVLKKIGMRHIGHNPAGFHKHGKDVPEEEYELTYEDWAKLKK